MSTRPVEKARILLAVSLAVLIAYFLLPYKSQLSTYAAIALAITTAPLLGNQLFPLAREHLVRPLSPEEEELRRALKLLRSGKLWRPEDLLPDTGPVRLSTPDLPLIANVRTPPLVPPDLLVGEPSHASPVPPAPAPPPAEQSEGQNPQTARGKEEGK